VTFAIVKDRNQEESISNAKKVASEISSQVNLGKQLAEKCEDKILRKQIEGIIR
jgi:hypothetical protein